MKKIMLLMMLLGATLYTKASDLGTETGYASYYHDMFHGRLTANGETFDQKKMSAAHKTLPFGTIVKVTRQDNGHSITVRINDRGPYVAGRIIDLSKKAGEALGILHAGTAKVTMEILSMPNKSQFVSAKANKMKEEMQPAPKKNTSTTAAVSAPKPAVVKVKTPTTIVGEYEFKGAEDYNSLVILSETQDIVTFHYVAHNISLDQKIDFEGVAQNTKIKGIYIDESGIKYTMKQFVFQFDGVEYTLAISEDYTKGTVHRNQNGESQPKETNLINLEVWLNRRSSND